MNKLLILALTLLAVFAIRTQDFHQQAKPAQSTQPAKPAQSTQPAKPAQQTQPAKPAQQTQPAQPHSSQHKPTNKQQAPARRTGYEAEVGDPFGNDTANKRTCFQVPCYEPTTGCAHPKRWNTIFYLVPTANGQKGRFVGYECK